MSVPECDRLDDYSLGGLSDEATAGFEAHLAGCPACRDELRRQQQIDGLLARATGQLEPVPSSLIDRIEQQVRRSRRRRVVHWAWGLSAAALAASVLAVWLAAGGFGTGNRTPPVVREAPEPNSGGEHVDPDRPQAPRADPVASVAIADPADAILVPVETKAPNVSIVWIYPTVKPVRAPSVPGKD